MSRDIIAISHEMSQIKKEVESWQGREMSEIEKDIVLGRLRELYHSIKQIHVASQTSDYTSLAKDTPRLEQPNPIEKSVITAHVPQHESAQEHSEYRDIDTDVMRKKMNKQAIMSLYDEAGVERDPENETHVETAQDIFDDSDVVARERHNFIAATEKLDNRDEHQETLADSYARMNKSTDVAEQLSKNSVTSLKKAIGVNDKFLIIRDVFNGNQSNYEDAIDKLESFDNLDDALLYIHGTYRWSPNNEGVKLIIELLTKKLS